MPQSLTVTPISAPVRDRPFDLVAALVDSLEVGDISPQDGDVLAISSKYASIASGRTVSLAEIETTRPRPRTGAALSHGCRRRSTGAR